MSGNWNRHYFKIKTQKKAGQALLELAIFGAFLIMLLGILINYGLRHNFQQQVAQEAFRRASSSAAESRVRGKPTSVTHVIVRDRHIPDPSNPWGVGSVMPFSSSATVTRNYAMQETADNEDELPRMDIDINGQKFSYTTAGFREEDDVDEKSIDKYIEIYGNTIQGCAGFIYGGAQSGECGRWELIDDGDVIKHGAVINRIRFIDSNAGQIINYDSAQMQCRQIVDRDAFMRECGRSKPVGSDKDCNKLADMEMQVPWYCAGATKLANGKYDFPKLKELFDGTAARMSMGLQPDYEKATTMSNKLEKVETSGGGITTTDTIDWQDTTKRKIITYDDKTGKTKEEEVTSSVSPAEADKQKIQETTR